MNQPTIHTAYGDVPVEALIKSYERERTQAQKKAEKRMEFLQTDEGKEWNRGKAKAYYERNKELIAEKRKRYYAEKKEILKQRRLERANETTS
jgi:hypothetical protein